MAFHQSAAITRHHTFTALAQPEPVSQVPPLAKPAIEDSQEWILFQPLQAESSTQQTDTTKTAGLSIASDLGSLNTAARSDRLDSEVLDDETLEDGELDDLDEGLHAFREPALYLTPSGQNTCTVLPTHDGLGMFPASSVRVQERLWQHEQYNSKRKYSGGHTRASSIHRRLETIDELEAQANEDKRMRIEQWRLEQSQALLDEVEKQTRRRMRHQSPGRSLDESETLESSNDVFGTTPTQRDYLNESAADDGECEPFWRRLTRKFIRDIIGIDEPLLSVILGESLPPEAYTQASLSALRSIPEQKPTESQPYSVGGSWRDRLLHRIARELGVLVHQLSPHPGAFTAYFTNATTPDYAGMPTSLPSAKTIKQHSSQPGQSKTVFRSSIAPNFPPTVEDHMHVASWGLEEESAWLGYSTDAAEQLRQEREYWERELDIRTVFTFLSERLSLRAPLPQHAALLTQKQDGPERAAVIRQFHPLVARPHRSPARLRRESRLHVRRPSSSCASESVHSSRKASVVRSGSSRHYWDIGGSVGSGSILASGGLMGAWGEA